MDLAVAGLDTSLPMIPAVKLLCHGTVMKPAKTNLLQSRAQIGFAMCGNVTWWPDDFNAAYQSRPIQVRVIYCNDRLRIRDFRI